MAKPNQNFGIAGFLLVLLGYIMAPWTQGYSLLPGILLCLVALVREKRIIWSSVGLLIGGYCLYWNLPPSAVPYPLNIPRFKQNASIGTFWLDYNRGHIAALLSAQGFLQSQSGGAILLEADDPNTFTQDHIIPFAKEHNWLFVEQTGFTSKHVAKALDSKSHINNDKLDILEEQLGADEHYELSKNMLSLHIYLYDVSHLACGRRC